MTRIDVETLQRLIDTRGAALVLYARQWCRSPEDAVQEAMIELARQATRPRDLVAWLYTTVRRRAMNLARADHRHQNHLRQVAQQQDRWFEADAAFTRESVDWETLLAQLTPVEREIVVAKTWGELTFAQIAELVELPLSTVHRRYQRALSSLGEKLQEPEEVRVRDESQPTPT